LVPLGQVVTVGGVVGVGVGVTVGVVVGVVVGTVTPGPGGLTPSIDLLEIALMTYSAVNPTLNIRTVTLF